MPAPSPNPARSTKPVIILGAGGHAHVLISLLKFINRPITALLDDNPAKHAQTLDGIPITGSLNALTQHPPNQVELVNAIGMAEAASAAGPRQTTYETYTQRGYTFASLIHPTAFIAEQASLAPGVQIMAGAILQPGVQIGENTLINTHASLDHDTTIGPHCHIAPGTTLCGNVTVGEACLIGAGATIIQGLTIGPNTTIGAGATVINNIPANQTAIGTPAKPI